MHGDLGHFKDIAQRRKARTEKAESRFDKKRLEYKISEEKTEFNFPKLSKFEIERIKQKIKKDLDKRQTVEYIIFSIIILILSVLVYYLVN